MSGDQGQVTCPHRGGPMDGAQVHLNYGGGQGEWVNLPPRCPSRECQEARDEAALADAIRRGVINP